MILWKLFAGFARVGLLGFGGGPAMLPLLQAECVTSGWVSEEEFLEAIAVGNALPGPITVKMAVYVGWHEAGFLGAVSAAFGITLPAAILMGLLSAIVMKYREHPVVEAALRGVKPAVVGMLAYVVWDLAPSGVVGVSGGLLAAGAFAALVWKVHPGFVMIAAMGIGMLVFRS